MTRALAAGLACLLLMAFPARAGTAPATLPFVQGWADTGQISVDDDWSGVTGVLGYRGDGLAGEPGSDPRGVTADGSGTPVDVTANLTDPRAVGLAAGVAEFELPDPVVAIQGSATASAPHLVLSLDARERAGVTVRLVVRDIDATAHDAVEPVALQYRVGEAGPFAAVAGGYVADATSGPGEATRASRVSVNLPASADGQPLVQVRVITTNAAGQDEWVGIDDIDISAASVGGGGPGGCPAPTPNPEPAPPDPGPAPAPGPGPGPKPIPAPRPPKYMPPELTGLELAPASFMPAKRGPAIARGGRAGTALRFRLSRAARVRFEVIQSGGATGDFAPRPRRGDVAAQASAARSAPRIGRRGRTGRRAHSTGGRFSAHGRRGLNRLRFSARVRGRPLAPGAYVLEARAVDRAGRTSAPAATRFRIGRED
jgi:hypothetical protein